MQDECRRFVGHNFQNTRVGEEWEDYLFERGAKVSDLRW